MTNKYSLTPLENGEVGITVHYSADLPLNFDCGKLLLRSQRGGVRRFPDADAANDFLKRYVKDEVPTVPSAVESAGD